jgi:hypothetical protein
MPVFTIGERVALKGLLAELQGGALGRVISVVEHHGGIGALDEYEVVFDDATKLRLCGFQLTHTKQGQKTQEGGDVSSS